MNLEKEMEQLADEYLEEGKRAFFDNRLNQAALLVQNALHLLKEAGKIEKYTSMLSFMGVIYAATGNETMAVDYYLEGLEYAVEHHLEKIMSMCYNNIGSRYQELNEHEKAILYFRKAAAELEKPSCKKEERHAVWCLITYMNLMFSYYKLGEYSLARDYQRLAEPFVEMEDKKLHQYSFLISCCSLCWSMGEKDYVYQHLEELLESGTKNLNTMDYVQDMKNLCGLLKEMGENERWKEAVLMFEKYAGAQDTVYFKLIQTEMWMEYYYANHDMDKYVTLCVEHARLYQEQRKVNDKERAAAIDLKIELREKEAERKRAEIKSTIDAVTGLGNRYLFEKDAALAIECYSHERKKIAVGVLDIDFFKQLNDTYGHIIGDACLKAAADILKETVGESGHVYRFGGDEFVVLLNCGNKEDVEKIASAVKDRLCRRKIESGNATGRIRLTISQGYACFCPKQDEKRESLIEHADKALYQVKKNGRDGFCILEE